MVDWEDIASEQEHERDCFEISCTLYKRDMITAFKGSPEFDTGHVVEYGKRKGEVLIARLSVVSSTTMWRSLLAWIKDANRGSIRESYSRLASEMYAYLTEDKAHPKSHFMYRDLSPEKNKLLFKYCLLAVANNLIGEKVDGVIQIAVPYHDREVMGRHEELLFIREFMDKERRKAWSVYRRRVNDEGWIEEEAAAKRDLMIYYTERDCRQKCLELRDRPYDNQIPPSGRNRPLRLK